MEKDDKGKNSYEISVRNGPISIQQALEQVMALVKSAQGRH